MLHKYNGDTQGICFIFTAVYHRNFLHICCAAYANQKEDYDADASAVKCTVLYTGVNIVHEQSLTQSHGHRPQGLCEGNRTSRQVPSAS
jgi:hypothetical protein